MRNKIIKKVVARERDSATAVTMQVKTGRKGTVRPLVRELHDMLLPVEGAIDDRLEKAIRHGY